MIQFVKYMGEKLMWAVLLLALTVSCINEDLSECGNVDPGPGPGPGPDPDPNPDPDDGKDYQIRYEVKLETNLQTELDENLTSAKELLLKEKLKEALSNVFSDQARDLDMRFYGVDSTLKYQEEKIVNKNSTSLVIYLPVEEYQHLALANDNQERNVYLEGEENVAKLAWRQQKEEYLDSYENGLFSARLKMEILDKDETFIVKMYMQNSAVALVLDPKGVKFKSIRGEMTRLADGFEVKDSVYTFNQQTVIRTKELGDTGSDLCCLYGVGLPSQDVPYAPTPARRSDSDEAQQQAGAFWDFRFYVTMPDDKVTLTKLFVKSPLKAGRVKILHAELEPDGTLETVKSEVGASVELDWKEGGEYNPEL